MSILRCLTKPGWRTATQRCSVSRLGRRDMFDTSSPSPSRKLHKFVVYAPDKTDADAVARRFAIRPKHLEVATPMMESGVIRVAGMMVAPECIESEGVPPKPLGSLIIYEAESLEDVKKLVTEDYYYKSGVWDDEKIVILPFLPVKL